MQHPPVQGLGMHRRLDEYHVAVHGWRPSLEWALATARLWEAACWLRPMGWSDRRLALSPGCYYLTKHLLGCGILPQFSEILH